MLVRINNKIADLLLTQVLSRFKTTDYFSSNDLGMTTLLCHRDVWRAMYCWSSLFYYLGYSLPIYIADDGSLTEHDKDILRRKFRVVIEEVGNREKRAKIVFSRYKYIYKFRFNEDAPVLRKKLDAFFLHPFKRSIYIDADVLFLSRPNRIIDWIRNNERTYLYSICGSSFRNKNNNEQTLIHIFRRLLYKYLHSSIDPYFSSGFLCFGSKDNSLLKILEKKLCSLYEVEYFTDWLTEETAMSLLFDQMNAVCLKSTQYINIWLNTQLKAITNYNPVFIHFAYETKKYFGVHVLRLLAKTSMFTNLR